MIAAMRNVPVVSRLIQSIGKRYYALRGIRFVIRKRAGATFLLDTVSMVDRNLLYFRAWEPDQQAFVHRHFRAAPPEVVLDIGSYFGLYAITLARRWPECEVVAFEPEPDNYRQLAANVLLNEAHNCTTHNVALGKESGTAVMTREPRNRGESRLSQIGIENGVRLEALDNLYDFSDKRIFMKIDVEGHELDAIAGMREILTRNTVVAQIEIFEPNRQSVIDELSSLGLNFFHQIDHDHFFSNAPTDKRHPVDGPR